MKQIEKENAKKLGEHIRKLRRSNSCSLNSFVLNNSSMTTATWSRVENAKIDVKFSTLMKIASVFNITIDELLKDIDFDYILNED